MEFDKSTGFDSEEFSLLFDNGGLDDVVLIPLVVGLTLRLESLSPVSSSSFIFLDGGTISFSLVVNVSSAFDDGGGVSGILNDLVFVVELGVTVALDPRRLPLRKIRSVDSCVDGIEGN